MELAGISSGEVGISWVIREVSRVFSLESVDV